MTRAPSSNAGKPAPPAGGACLIDVRYDGALLKRVAPAAAEELCARGWGEWRGTGKRRAVHLAGSAPVSSLHQSIQGDNTRRIRDAGGVLIAPDYSLEHRPISRF